MGGEVEGKRFCTSCGAPLSDGQRFCEKCGQDAYPIVGAAASSERKARRNENVNTAIIVGAFLVAIIVVGIIVITKISAGSPQAIPQSVVQEGSTETPAYVPSLPISPASQTEIAFYEELCGYYDELGVFNQRISDAADAFNASYLNPDYSTRQRYADEAQGLRNEIQAWARGLAEVTSPPGSANAGKLQDIETCYSDCISRIGVICEAWSISVAAKDPSEQKDAIIEPIYKDNDGNGNKFYNDFVSRYPSARPLEP